VIEQLVAEPIAEAPRPSTEETAAAAAAVARMEAYEAALSKRVRRRRGRIAILHEGGDAQIFHEKRLLGTTPGVFVMRPGRYRIRAVDANGEEHLKRVRVRKHRTTKLKFQH
jgi:hypothetical protein